MRHGTEEDNDVEELAQMVARQTQVIDRQAVWIRLLERRVAALEQQPV